MAIVSLGIRDLFVGNLPVIFDSFNYDERRAYHIELQFTSTNFDNIFSRLALYARISPNNEPVILDSRKFFFDIVSDRLLLFYPLNRLVGGNGDIEFLAERVPIWRGAGDGEPVSLELFYDDANNIGSWIN